MDVRKLVLTLCVLILLAIGVVIYFQTDVASSGPRRDPGLAKMVDERYGAALRTMGVRSLSVDRETDDVVVVLAEAGRKGRNVARRLPGLAGKSGCGELDVGIAVGEDVEVWGSSSTPGFKARLDCVMEEVIAEAASLRQVR